MTLPDPIRCVMVGTTHPGNIGAAARALKTMGLRQLDLVTPRYFPHPEAVAMASGAEDLFAQTRVFDSLAEAVADCGLVIGLTARSRRLASENLTVRECCARVQDAANHYPVALVFGREHSGLSNDELNHCHFHVHIPANPDYSSLNVAAAVQIIAYELRMAKLAMLARLASDTSDVSDVSEAASVPAAIVGECGLAAHLDKAEPPYLRREVYVPAPQGEVDRLLEHLEGALLRSGFLDPGNPRRLLYRLRRFFQRARPDQNEVNIWRGILASFEAQDPPHFNARKK